VDENGNALVNASILVLETKQGNVTDLDGQFGIPGVTSGEYSVSVSSLGYGTQEFKDIYVGSDSTTTLNSTLLLKILPMTMVEIVTRWRAMGTIAGRVVDENDVGIPSAEVLVYTSSGLVHIDVERPRRVFTDESGRYFCSTYIGTCAIEVNYLGYIRQKIRDIKIHTGDTTTVNVKLVRELRQSEAQIMGVVTGKIAGTVKDKNGEGIIGATVQILGTSQGAQVYNPNGSFVILGVVPGRYTLKVESIGYTERTLVEVEVLSGSTTALNAKLKEAPVTYSYSNSWRKYSYAQLEKAYRLHPSMRVKAKYRKYLSQQSSRDCY